MKETSARPALARTWGLGLGVLGFLPLVNWIGGGHSAEWYGVSLSEWVSGAAISLGVALVLFVVLRRFDRWPVGTWDTISRAAVNRPVVTGLGLGAAALSLYATIARSVLSSRPLLIDEIVQVMQARIFAEGRVARVASDLPEFFSALHVVDVNGSVFSQFPPGGPLMLVPGVLAGAAWLTGPFFGALAVFAFWHLVRSTERSAGTALGAALLLAASPFMAFMAGSHMNHVPTLAWLCIALWSLERVTRSARGRAIDAFVMGLSLGMMVSIRPVDGAAFAVPAGLWLLVRTVRRETSLATLLASGVGIACWPGL